MIIKMKVKGKPMTMETACKPDNESKPPEATVAIATAPSVTAQKTR